MTYRLKQRMNKSLAFFLLSKTCREKEIQQLSYLVLKVLMSIEHEHKTYLQKHRKSVSTHVPKTLKNPFAIM